MDQDCIGFWHRGHLSSNTCRSGARYPRMGEPLVKVETYPIQWREPRLDLAELARLRWVDGFSKKELAERYGKTTVAIQNYFQELRRLDFYVSGLSKQEREKVLWASKNSHKPQLRRWCWPQRQGNSQNWYERCKSLSSNSSGIRNLPSGVGLCW